ncbi:MCE family protein [Rhodococcus sp. HM1]|uniref:MCE family protein n=1 Tax=Rhodococcus sp. HM1 TaxID=2937759 RepID=UPI00200B64E8|nr:MCE family protein [Rhodococcus sp. HM1]MCK8672408.1 MCE family protein [Rhodococcus sp. HM1]
MLRYRSANLIRNGIIGTVLITCILLVGLQAQAFITAATTLPYRARFVEAGGLRAGDDVVVSGVEVGTVSKVSLLDGDALVEYSVDSSVRLGSATTAHIKTGSLLGKRILTLVSDGPGLLRPNEVIPTDRTSSPYSLTDAVGDLTTNVSGIATDAVNRSLDLLSTTLERIEPQLGPTFDGLTELSRSLNDRNESLRDLLTATRDVTGILADRSAQVNTLILDANTLVAVLAERRQAIVDLLANTAAVSEQLSSLVADNEAELAPTLDRLNSVAALLEENRDNIAAALPGLAKVALTQGEAVSGGPFYNAFVANLVDGHMIQPFVDQALGVDPPAVFLVPGQEPR